MNSLFKNYLTEGWEEEFGMEFQPPEELQEMLTAGILTDKSWHNDSMPRFQVTNTNYQFWVAPTDENLIESPSSRFFVNKVDDKGEFQTEDIFETDNLNVILKWIGKVKKNKPSEIGPSETDLAKDYDYNITNVIYKYWKGFGFKPISTGGGCDYMFYDWNINGQSKSLLVSDGGESPDSINEKTSLNLYTDDEWMEGYYKEFDDSFAAAEWLNKLNNISKNTWKDYETILNYMVLDGKSIQ